MVLISIEGCIGAGKTTLINQIMEMFFNCSSVSEDVFSYTHFQAPSGMEFNPLLEMYTDPQTSTTAAQLHLMESCCKNICNSPAVAKAKQNCLHHVLMDRCLFSCPVFIELAFQSGHINAFVRDFLLASHERLVCDHHIPQPDVKVYVEPTLEVCMRNIRKRQREGEQVIDENRLSKLMNLLSKERNETTGCKTVVLKVEAKDAPIDVLRKFYVLMDELDVYFGLKASEEEVEEKLVEAVTQGE